MHVDNQLETSIFKFALNDGADDKLRYKLIFVWHSWLWVKWNGFVKIEILQLCVKV